MIVPSPRDVAMVFVEEKREEYGYNKITDMPPVAPLKAEAIKSITLFFFFFSGSGRIEKETVRRWEPVRLVNRVPEKAKKYSIDETEHEDKEDDDSVETT